MSDIKIKTLEEIKKMSIDEIEAYCKENKVYLVIEDGEVTQVCPN